MKISVFLVLFMAFAVPILAATTFPASTNANQTFFGANSFSFPITLLSSTASTLQKVDGSKATASIANGTGALTNNGSGVFGWLSTFGDVTIAMLNSTSNAILSQVGISINSLSNNLTATINSTSNSILSQTGTSINSLSNNIYNSFTNASILFQNIDYTTNATMAPDFSKGYSATNVSSGFTFLSPLHVDSTKTKVQTAVVRVDNTSGSAIVIAPPANVFVISNSFMGVGANGTTWFTFVSYPPDRTNVYASAEAH